MEDIKLDLEEPQEAKKVKTKKTVAAVEEPTVQTPSEYQEEPLKNCLRNERVIVRYILKQRRLVTNPKHVLYGGLADTATRTFCTPKLSSGHYVNVLTNSEKKFLEHALGLEENALSIYKPVNNYWDSGTGRSEVILGKQDTYLDLSNPSDYIKYKILLANKDTIAPSLQVLQDTPKASYQFVIIAEGDEAKVANDEMSIAAKCYVEYGKHQDDFEVLRLVVETIDGRPVAQNTKIEFLRSKINNLIKSNAKTFYKVISDPLLDTKVLIRQSIEIGTVQQRGTYLYLKDGNLPLCENNEEPTLNSAAKFLNAPKHQDILFALQAKLNS